MKYSIIIIGILYSTSFFAGVNCIDNSEHLKKRYDDKEWHSISCDCNCEIIKGGYCTECKHLQNAHPLMVITPKPKKIVSKQWVLQSPKNLQDFLRNSVIPYLQNK